MIAATTQMPSSARITSEAEENLEKIKETYDVDVRTSQIIEKALEQFRETREQRIEDFESDKQMT